MEAAKAWIAFRKRYSTGERVATREELREAAEIVGSARNFLIANGGGGLTTDKLVVGDKLRELQAEVRQCLFCVVV
jgi:hypothetical protein